MKYLIPMLIACNAVMVSNTFAGSESTQNLTDDTVIATWQPRGTSVQTIAEAEELLIASRYLTAKGNERERVAWFVQTQRQLPQSQTDKAGVREQLAILEARLMQGVHQFEQARQRLATINSFRLPAAQLLLADIHLQQGNNEQAKKHCERLIGQVGNLLAFTCMMNAEFARQESRDVFDKLRQLDMFAATASPQERQWYHETLADMALQLGEPEIALSYLSKTPLHRSPISALLLWAEANMALDKHGQITETFHEIVPDINNLDDGLLLKWAMSERALGITGSQVQSRLAKNMEIRTWREDSSHAAQVANYFLSVEPNPTLALKFAKLNWQFAQASDDEALLKRAQHSYEVSKENGE